LLVKRVLNVDVRDVVEKRPAKGKQAEAAFEQSKCRERPGTVP
jgi:hypothetical protein